MPQRVENKISQLLSRDENEQVFNLLGTRCQSLATCVIQLYTTQGPLHSQWIKKDTGILCFIKDNIRKSYFFRLFCVKRRNLIWEQEVYNNMEYIDSCPFLHTFEGEDCMIAFNFASETEALELKEVVEERLRVRKKKERKKILLNDQTLSLPTNNDPKMYKKYTDPAETKAKRRRNLTTADVGHPSEFRHVLHVGWDPEMGFDVANVIEDPVLQRFFDKAGVSKKQLQDKKSREFIYDFIAKNGGRDAVVQEQVQKTTTSTRKPAPAPPSPVGGPPVPPRGPGRSHVHSRAAPPPPPTPTAQPPRPPPTPKSLPQENSIPPPPSIAAPIPPPPPPMDIPAPPPLILSENKAPPANNMRAALMESIRSGTSLKPVEVEKRPNSMEDARGDLMSEIRRGAFQLKPANEREMNPVTPPAERSVNDLAGALARALADRNRVIHSEDDDTSDTDSNEEDWDA